MFIVAVLERWWDELLFRQAADDDDDDPYVALRNLLPCAVWIRIGMLLAMAVSNALLPNHDASGVVHVDLRSIDTTCFALQGSFCHCGRHCEWKDWEDGTCFEGSGVLRNKLQAVYTFLLTPLTRWDAARFVRLAHQPQLWKPLVEGCSEIVECADALAESEQSHAFYPLFPAVIQYTTLLILQLPRQVIPGTCEQAIVLAAWLVNTVCFVGATAALFSLTRTVTHSQSMATRTAVLFMLNPANVFFGTVYSESLFAMMVFTGGALLARRGSSVSAAFVVACWWLSSLIRSNGIIYMGYLLLWGLGYALQKKRVVVIGALTIVGTAGLIATSIQYHSYRGFDNHCRGPVQPDWCSRGPTFHLYGHVQRKYWHVGPFRYYQLKQLPNFLLAAPIMVLSFFAVTNWIRKSWERSMKDERVTIRTLVLWMRSALQDFVGGTDQDTEDWYARHMLGHYAVLGTTALLGLVVAHVQISTRMICSSCPALYWHMASCMSSSKWGHYIIGYCALYIALGVILHSNWLPWT